MAEWGLEVLAQKLRVGLAAWGLSYLACYGLLEAELLVTALRAFWGSSSTRDGWEGKSVSEIGSGIGFCRIQFRSLAPLITALPLSKPKAPANLLLLLLMLLIQFQLAHCCCCCCFHCASRHLNGQPLGEAGNSILLLPCTLL